jgi:uncharacterized protein (TIGR02001 family)
MSKFYRLAAAAALLAMSAAPTLAADLGGSGSYKDAPVAAPASPWDYAFGGSIANDYVFRGISQSARGPSASAYTELRYNLSSTLQLYGALAGNSIDYPNRAAAEIDWYGGIRPTIGKLSLDLGYWYYAYPKGQTFDGKHGAASCTNGTLGIGGIDTAGNCNVYEADLSFWEVFAKGTYQFTDAFSLGGSVYYSPSWLSTGADGTYASGNAKYVLPASLTPKNIGAYVSAEYGHYWMGETKAFYGPVKLPDYNTWNVGGGFTYKVFTLDLRYSDTNLSAGDCNALTSDHTTHNTSPSNVTASNSSGFGSSWCGATFIAKLGFDLTSANLALEPAK